MKKASLFLITLILAMAFTACGEITHETKNPELKPTETKATETDAPDADVPETDAEEEETKAPETKAPETDAPEVIAGEETITQTVLLAEAGVKITAKSLDKSGWMGPELKLLIENNTDKNLTVQVRNCSVNGYMIDPSISADVTPGKKVNASILFMDSSLEKAGIDTFADIEFSFHVFDSETWDDYIDSSLITLKTSAADTYNYTYDDSGEVIYEKNSIKIVAKELITDTLFGPELKLYIYNGSDQSITVQTRDDSVNGFMVTTVASFEIGAGKHCVDEITFLSSDLEENEITEITEYEFSLHIFNSDKWGTIDDSDPIVLTFN